MLSLSLVIAGIRRLTISRCANQALALAHFLNVTSRPPWRTHSTSRRDASRRAGSDPPGCQVRGMGGVGYGVCVEDDRSTPMVTREAVDVVGTSVPVHSVVTEAIELEKY
jgi:hypothetical protein